MKLELQDLSTSELQHLADSIENKILYRQGQIGALNREMLQLGSQREQIGHALQARLTPEALESRP